MYNWWFGNIFVKIYARCEVPEWTSIFLRFLYTWQVVVWDLWVWLFFLNMYVYININLCKFRRLPSCGQAQGVVPFLRCWETYCAKQVCFPLLKNIQSAQSSKPLSTGHCWGNGFQNPFGRENAQKKWHGSFVPSWAQGRPNDPMYQLSRYKRRSGYGDGSLLDMFLVCSYQDLLAGFDGDFWA